MSNAGTAATVRKVEAGSYVVRLGTVTYRVAENRLAVATGTTWQIRNGGRVIGFRDTLRAAIAAIESGAVR